MARGRRRDDAQRLAHHARQLHERWRRRARPAQFRSPASVRNARFRVEYRRPLAVGSLAVALEISNLTNRRNQCCVDVEVEDIGTPEESIVVEDQFWPGLLPSLSIEWEL